MDRNSNMAREAVRTTMNSLSSSHVAAPVEHNTLQQQVSQPVHLPMTNLAAPHNVATHTAAVAQPEQLNIQDHLKKAI